MIISDNDPQSSLRKFMNFANIFILLHLICSSYHPQGNRKAEHAVHSIKHLIKKVSDPYIVLLNYHSIPLQHEKIPAKLLMSKKL